MITDEDVIKLKQTFATREDVDTLSIKVDGIQEQLGDLKVEVGELGERFDSLEHKFDKMLGMLEASLEDHGAEAAHLARHDRQISALATHAGIQLPD